MRCEVASLRQKVRIVNSRRSCCRSVAKSTMVASIAHRRNSAKEGASLNSAAKSCQSKVKVCRTSGRGIVRFRCGGRLYLQTTRSKADSIAMQKRHAYRVFTCFDFVKLGARQASASSRRKAAGWSKSCGPYGAAIDLCGTAEREDLQLRCMADRSACARRRKGEHYDIRNFV
jgi:hypothetical protein